MPDITVHTPTDEQIRVTRQMSRDRTRIRFWIEQRELGDALLDPRAFLAVGSEDPLRRPRTLGLAATFEDGVMRATLFAKIEGVDGGRLPLTAFTERLDGPVPPDRHLAIASAALARRVYGVRRASAEERALEALGIVEGLPFRGD